MNISDSCIWCIEQKYMANISLDLQKQRKKSHNSSHKVDEE